MPRVSTAICAEKEGKEVMGRPPEANAPSRATRREVRPPCLVEGDGAARVCILWPMQRTTVTLGSLLLVTLVSRSAWAETYAVGPSRALKTLQALPVTLQPGDVVELDGNATYPGGVIFRGDGTAGSKVTIRGIKVDGKRPIISGSAAGIELRGKHYVI